METTPVKESKDLEVHNESMMTIQGFLNVPKIKGYLDNVLKERAGQFVTSLVSLVNLEGKLQKCNPRSIMMCGLKAAALNLPIDNNLGFAYVIPYGKEAQFQLGFKAFIQLAMRTGQFQQINVIDIREGELKSWDPLTENLELQAIPADKNKEKLPIIGYAAMFTLKNGFRKVIYRGKESLLAHGKRFSKTFSNGPWQSDTDAMCRKTLLKELLSRWAPLSTDMMEGIRADQAIIRENEHTGEQVYEYIDAGAEPEAITYDLDEKTLAELEDYFNILKTNQADRAMKLAQCKGNPDAVTALKAELMDAIKHMPSASGNKVSETQSSTLLPPEEETIPGPFDKKGVKK